MGIIKDEQIANENHERMTTWGKRPISYEVTINGDYARNLATSWVREVISDQEVELRCVRESPNDVIYRGVYPTEKEARIAIATLVRRAKCHHVAR